ncbi:calcium-transporting ATPase 8, plasma membrane-type [Artemisia annua]|uniref:Calcium-transporting ATPase 8, plasma membrane-type n=1 Tax=Artemisia annua TaxID=35608 RepID=A0A2U1KXF8_ARTAN|nr:calcium-transporting ATPase 8, plasma membrane-type [Artemisia annua]
MGIQGTEVAKESSDVIIFYDNFALVVKVVWWTRQRHDGKLWNLNNYQTTLFKGTKCQSEDVHIPVDAAHQSVTGWFCNVSVI